mgnify:CR=1 FL=1
MTNPTTLPDSSESSSAEFDAARGTIHASVDIAAPPDAVFEALLDPAQLATWWGSDDSYRTHDWDIDAHVGGEWAVHTISTSGDEGTVRGEYLAIDEPRSLEYTWRASWDDFAPTIVRYELTPILIDDTEGTQLDVTHRLLRIHWMRQHRYRADAQMEWRHRISRACRDALRDTGACSVTQHRSHTTQSQHHNADTLHSVCNRTLQPR